ncbi:MAG: 3-hydroxyacyl-ACP dehydratase FabZ [Rhodospirillaceae bacterium]|jgi:3-hydroxyacyl-[acyl-carrier-protein] dehydratase
MDKEVPASSEIIIDVEQIMSMLPHRYPFLMLDRVVDLVPGESAVGLKNVTINEPFFPGHFPTKPIMPGVLIIEAMAQTAAILVVHSLEDAPENNLVYFMSIENARFRKPVVPGDTLMIHVTPKQSRGKVWKFEGVAKVDGAVVAEATYTAMIVDNE